VKKILRISDRGHNPIFPKNVTKEICIRNFIDVFGSDIIVIADNCFPETIENLRHLGVSDIRSTPLGNSGSLKYAFEICYNELNPDECVYLCEGDFLHLPYAENLLYEGLQIADYVTLYDHLDKYQSPSQNPLVEDGGENTKVLFTKTIHWKYTNSTVQTFCTQISTLIEDKEILYKHNFRSETPQSFLTFLELGHKGRKLASSIPGRSTACDRFPSPGINWELLVENYIKEQQ